MSWALDRIKREREEAKATLVVLFIAMACLFIMSAILWPYTINKWLVYFGKSPVFKWYYGGFLSFFDFFNKIVIPAAILTWILMMFLQ